MENFSRILSVSAISILLSACQAQYKTTDDPRANNLSGVTSIPTPTPSTVSNRAPEPIRETTRGGGVQRNEGNGSTVRTQPVRRDPPVNPGGGEWGRTDSGGTTSTRTGSGTPTPSRSGTVSGGDRPITTVVGEGSQQQVVTVSAGNVPSQGGPCYCKEHDQLISRALTNKVDLLIVVDPKVATKDREDVANSLLEHLPQNLDYRVGILPAYSSASALSGSLYASTNDQNPKVLGTSASDKVTATSWSSIRNIVRDRMINLPLEGPNAKANERGLTALSKAFNGGTQFYNLVSGGMIRPNAALAIVIVGDINDEKDFKTADLLARIKQFKRDMPFTVNGIFSQPSINANQRGYGYLDLIRLAHGNPVHITMLSEGVADISENIYYRLFEQIEFQMHNRAQYNGEEITVQLDGVKQSKNIGYYDQQTGKYLLNSVGRAGSRVRIEFCK